MKRVFCLIILAAFLSLGGCAKNIDTENLADASAKAIAILVLHNNPQYKDDVATALNATKVFISGEVSYNEAVTFLANKFTNEEDKVVVQLALSAFLFKDEPIINSIGMFDTYKEDLIKRIDYLIMIAEM